MPFHFEVGGIEIGGRWFPVSWGEVIPQQPSISSLDVVAISEEFNVPPSHLDAIIQVEAGKSGFLLNEPVPSRPKILFEAHHFYRLTPAPVSHSRPDLACKHWDRKLYKGGSHEWDRLKDACEFDFYNALMSASWGLGQIMGENFTLAGCESIDEFVVRNFTSEREQFILLVNFFKNSDLIEALRAGDWELVARRYNGPGYKENHYDARLARCAITSRLA